MWKTVIIRAICLIDLNSRFNIINTDILCSMLKRYVIRYKNIYKIIVIDVCFNGKLYMWYYFARQKKFLLKSCRITIDWIHIKYKLEKNTCESNLDCVSRINVILVNRNTNFVILDFFKYLPFNELILWKLKNYFVVLSFLIKLHMKEYY